MGKQINFYIDHKIEVLLVDYAHELGLHIFQTVCETEDFPKEVKNYNRFLDGKDSELYPYVFWALCPEDLVKDQYEESGKKLVAVHGGESMAIQYNRPNFDKDRKTLVRGRLYYPTYRYDERANKVRVNKKLDDCYSKLVSKIRSMCTNKGLSFYMGNNVYDDLYPLVVKDDFTVY